MAGLRITCPCRRCGREASCAWLLRGLRGAIAEARLQGLSEDAMPEVVVDCTAHFVPLNRHIENPGPPL